MSAKASRQGHSAAEWLTERPLRIFLLFAIEILAIDFLKLPDIMAWDHYAFCDAGANLTLQYVTSHGLRPTIDFGYNYGLLPILAGRIWFGIADDSSIASVVDDRLRFGDCVGDRENRVTNTIWRHRLGVDSDHARICGASELSLARAGGRGGVTGVRARVSGARIACERARLRVRRGLYQTQHGLHLLAGVAGRDCVSAPGGGVRRSTIGSGN